MKDAKTDSSQGLYWPRLILLLLMALTGCQSEEAIYPVRGRVVLDDGSPLIAGRVSFESTVKQISAEGYTDANGEFTMTTFAGGDGALLGEHKIVVTPPPPRPIDSKQRAAEVAKFEGVKPEDIAAIANAPPPALILSKYADFDKSGLKFTVEKKQDNVCHLTVERWQPEE